MNDILLPIIIVGALGLLFGIILSVASIVMHVKKDERIEKITAALPGANCGGCGYTGCEGFASAIVKDGVSPSKCAVGGQKVADEIAKILGISSRSVEKRCAVVLCHGTPDITRKKYDYKGISTCKAATALFSGDGACQFSCIGLGDCRNACKFDAIRIIDGIARINMNACTNCGACVRTCPKHLIQSVPMSTPTIVLCSNQDKGKAVMDVCKGGCISCMKCVKTCPSGAIEMVNNVARINPSKCTNCGACVEACPVHCIFRNEPASHPADVAASLS